MEVKFETCGDALCDAIVWLKPGEEIKAHVGQRVFFDMRPAGASTWSGKAVAPGDGKTYSGKMIVDGSSLAISGCLTGGLLCKSTHWTRSP